MFEFIDLRPGKIIWSTPHLDTREDAIRDLEDLKFATLRQDMFYAQFPGNYEIDVGWYYHDSKEWSDFSAKECPDANQIKEEDVLQYGVFQIRIIKDKNWYSDEIPGYQCVTFKELESLMQQAVEYVRKEIDWKDDAQ